MPWITFTADFDWRDPRMMRRHEIFRAGMVRLVTTPCAHAAIDAGKARKPKKNERSRVGRSSLPGQV